jgi:hypothetical protein
MSAAEEMLQENATTVDRTVLRGFEAQSNKVSAQIFITPHIPKRDVKTVGF